jgi:excisionase family DNA binding protein
MLINVTALAVCFATPPLIAALMRAAVRLPLLTPSQVAVMFRVNPATVARWEKEGKLTSIRTSGGHRRYREDEVRALLKEGEPDVPE